MCVCVCGLCGKCVIIMSVLAFFLFLHFLTGFAYDVYCLNMQKGTRVVGQTVMSWKMAYAPANLGNLAQSIL